MRRELGSPRGARFAEISSIDAFDFEFDPVRRKLKARYLALAARAKLAFQVISERYDHRRSTLITSNRTFKDWSKVFPDPLNAQVIAERLTERSELFLMNGKGFRNPKTD